MRCLRSLPCLLLSLCLATAALAGETRHDYNPESVTSKLRAKAKTEPGLLAKAPLPWVQNWLDWKLAVKKEHGLDFAVDYKFLYQSATDSPGQSVAGGGVVDFYGRWRLLDGEDTSGTFGFAFDNRHKYTETSPKSFYGQLGAQWPTSDGWGVHQFAWKQWWWQQGFAGDSVRVTLGKLNPGSYYEQNRLADADHYFLSYSLADNPAGNQPNEGIGANLSVDQGDWTLSAGAHDADGKTTNFGFETIGRKEFFVEGQAQLRTDWDGLEGNWRLTLWNQPPGKEEDRLSGSGLLAGFDQELVNTDRYTVLAAVRYGYEGEKASDTRQFLSGSVALDGILGSKGNGLGLGASWGEPSDRSLRSQYVIETFMRLQLTPSLQLTPDLQLIVHPTNAPDVSDIGVVGLRIVLSL